MKLFSKILLPILVIFVSFTILIFTTDSFLQKFYVDQHVLLGANVLFLSLGIFVFFMQKKAMLHSNPNVFIRSVIAGTMIKMFATVIAVLAYVVLVGKDYNKRAVFIALFMYLIYLAAEVFAITKVNNKKNA